MTALLSAEELAALEQGLPRLSEWGEDLLVPFPVHQLRSASVLWLNTRWFLERGVDVTDTEVLSRVQAWLIETFGYLVPEPEHKRSAFSGKTKTAHADRYGSSSGLAKHGGSGRAAVYGCFQAKGVGATPLVGIDVPPDHSNGCMSLGEAIREAIYAEIIAAEFPYGAIPVISVLDTGLYYSAPEPGTSGSRKIRRALIIRPSVLRPAHAERAPLFKRSVTGDVNAQKGDANRTRMVVRRWLLQGHDQTIPAPQESLGRLAEQAAFGHVHRLYGGGFFSSNVAISGELHDFGNAYAFPDWVNAKVLAHTPGFGKELEAIGILAKSMDFYFRKYGEKNSYQLDSAELTEYAKVRYRKAFARECLRIWQAESLATTEAGHQIVELLTAFFRRQQNTSRRYGWSGEVVGGHAMGGWLYDALIAQESDHADQAAKHVVRQVDAWLRRGFESSPDLPSRLWISWMTASRLLRPRHTADRGFVLRSIIKLTSQLDPSRRDCSDQITDFIRTSVNHGRAHWPRLPAGLAVLAHVTCDGCTALLCSEGPDSPQKWWLEGGRLEGRVYLFGGWVPLKAIELGGHDVKTGDRYCSFLVSASETQEGVQSVLRLGCHEIRLPEATRCVHRM